MNILFLRLPSHLKESAATWGSDKPTFYIKRLLFFLRRPTTPPSSPAETHALWSLVHFSSFLPLRLSSSQRRLFNLLQPNCSSTRTPTCVSANSSALSLLPPLAHIPVTPLTLALQVSSQLLQVLPLELQPQCSHSISHKCLFPNSKVNLLTSHTFITFSAKF